MNAPADVMAAVIDQGHFKGIAVVIDDQYDKETEIGAIIDAIRAAGGHVVPMKELPGDAADLDNLAGASFFILDWNLTGLEHGVEIPAELAADQLRQKVEFLTRLRESRHAPVFIFTNEDPNKVREALEAGYPGGGSNILVKQKTDVGAKVYEVLNDWARELPSVLTLKSWERQNHRAINTVFKDLHDKDPFWPVFLWKMFKDDHIIAPDELGRLITRLVTSRMHSPEIDLDGFLPKLDEQFKANPAGYKAALTAVLESERFLRAKQLDPDSFSTGDVFAETSPQGVTTYYINVRAECDCIKHPGASTGPMHLLTGNVATDVQVDPVYGQVYEQHNEAIVFAMYEGNNFRFKFKPAIKPKEFGPAWRDRRIGRLLPPFLIRLLERYAAYAQRPGIPRVPSALIPVPPPASEPSARDPQNAGPPAAPAVPADGG